MSTASRRAGWAERSRRYRAENRETIRDKDHARRTTEAHRDRDRTRRANRANRTAEQLAADRIRLRPDGMKWCRQCKLSLPVGEFYACAPEPDGLMSKCRAHNRTRLLRVAAPRWADEDFYACVYCGHDFEDVEHVWCQADGGPEHPQNLVPSCRECNRGPDGKHTDDVLTFVTRKLGSDVVARALSWPVRVIEID